MASTDYVVQGALVECDCGTDPSELVAQLGYTVTGNKLSILNSDTSKATFNPKTFGTCSAKAREGKSCSLKPVDLWFGAKEGLSHSTVNNARYMQKYLANMEKAKELCIRETTEIGNMYFYRNIDAVVPSISKNKYRDPSVTSLKDANDDIQEIQDQIDVLREYSGFKEASASDLAKIGSYIDQPPTFIPVTSALVSWQMEIKPADPRSEEYVELMKRCRDLDTAQVYLNRAKDILEKLSLNTEDKHAPLTTNSVLICTHGGVISIKKNGQWVREVRGGAEYWKIPAFLPETVLQKGAYGRTVKILQYALQDVYEQGIISLGPFPYNHLWYYDDLNSTTPPSSQFNDVYNCDHIGYFGDTTQMALDAYIAQGTPIASGKPLTAATPLKSAAGDYYVDIYVWESLDLAVGQYISDMWTLKASGSNSSVKLSLNQNKLTINYYPTFYITRHPSETLVDRYWPVPEVKPDDEPDVYEKYIRQALTGLLHWTKEAENGDVLIHGIPLEVELNIYDKNGKKFVPNWDKIGSSTNSSLQTSCEILKSTDFSETTSTGIRPQGVLSPDDVVSGATLDTAVDDAGTSYDIRIGGSWNYDFIADSAGKAIIKIEENVRELSTMVSDVFLGWSVNSEKKITWRMSSGFGYHQRWATHYSYNDFTIEHEFGHVLGLYDMYGYFEHNLGIEPIGYFMEFVFTGETPQDQQTARYDDVMRCKYGVLWGASGLGKKRPWIRTPIDWEMILWAWQESKLQNYIERTGGKKSVAFYYSIHDHAYLKTDS